MKLRDELAYKVNKHFEKIGANTDDVFKYGFDACENRYLPMLEKLESALKIQPRYSDDEDELFERHSYRIAKQALEELEEFKKKMNGDEK